MARTRRSKVKYPGLHPELHPKTRHEHLEVDYVDQLSDKDKAWLSTFNEEYVGCDFHHKGRKLHKTKALRRECYSRNNSRNRDLYTISRTRGWVMPLEEGFNQREELPSHFDHEDVLVTLIDIQESGEYAELIEADDKRSKPRKKK